MASSGDIMDTYLDIAEHGARYIDTELHLFSVLVQWSVLLIVGFAGFLATIPLFMIGLFTLS